MTFVYLVTVGANRSRFFVKKEEQDDEEVSIFESLVGSWGLILEIRDRGIEGGMKKREGALLLHSERARPHIMKKKESPRKLTSARKRACVLYLVSGMGDRSYERERKGHSVILPMFSLAEKGLDSLTCGQQKYDLSAAATTPCRRVQEPVPAEPSSGKGR